MKTCKNFVAVLLTLLLLLSIVGCNQGSSIGSEKETESLPISDSMLETDSSTASDSVLDSESNGESTIESESSTTSSLVVVVGNMVVIKVDASYMDITQTTVLVDYMTKLKEDGALDFSIKDGMVNSINGQENPADWSKCWMLYSDDAELTNETWGYVTLDGVKYSSTVLGAEALPIKDGKTYVWEFKSF